MKYAMLLSLARKVLALNSVLFGFFGAAVHAQAGMAMQNMQMQQPMVAGAQALLTGNMEADDMIRQMGVAAVCGMASNAAQNAQGGLGDVVQGAIAGFCGMQNPMGMMAQQPTMMQQPSMGVALAPINLNGIGGGMGGMPGMSGMLPNAMPIGMNPNMIAGMVGGQLSPEQMMGQIAGQVVGQAIGNALGGGQGGIGNAMAGNLGAVATGGLMNANLGGGMMGAGMGTPNVGQMVGAMVGTAIQQRIGGATSGMNGGMGGTANYVAGLPVVQGTAQPVMAYAYRPITNLGQQSNLTLSPQSGIRVGAPLVLQTYNVNGQTFVDTRPLNELRGGVRMAGGDEAAQVGMRLGAFSNEVGGDIQQASFGAMATQVDPKSAVYQEGFGDGLNGLDIDPFLGKDQNYKAGYDAGQKQAKARNPVV